MPRVTTTVASFRWPLLALALVGLASRTAGRLPDVGYVPTPQPIVDAMLKLAKVRPGELVYDLGCGDGRAVITAARDFGARGVGVDIDPERIAESRANAAVAGVLDRVRFEQADLFQLPFADADVLFLYLLPDLNVRLRPRILDELRPGTRVISHAFTMGDWAPDRISQVGNIPIFFWIVPAKIAGEWSVALPGGAAGTLSLRQRFQEITGTLTVDSRTVAVQEARVAGNTLTFRYAAGWRTVRVTAAMEAGRLRGTMDRGWASRRQSWAADRR